MFTAERELVNSIISSCVYKAVAQAVHPISQSAFQLTPLYTAEVHTRSARTNPQFAKKSQGLYHKELLLEVMGPTPLETIAANLKPSISNQVRQIACNIYNHNRFSELPILADALEEAGCTEETVLDHCRGQQHHIRGCWVIDLLLGWR